MLKSIAQLSRDFKTFCEVVVFNATISLTFLVFSFLNSLAEILHLLMGNCLPLQLVFLAIFIFTNLFQETITPNRTLEFINLVHYKYFT